MRKTAFTKTRTQLRTLAKKDDIAPSPRSHLAAWALWRVNFHSSSDTRSFLGTRSERKWNRGHQSARSSQSMLKFPLPCSVQNCLSVWASVSQAVTHCRQSAWSSLMKTALRISSSPFDSSAGRMQNKNRKPWENSTKFYTERFCFKIHPLPFHIPLINRKGTRALFIYLYWNR